MDEEQERKREILRDEIDAAIERGGDDRAEDLDRIIGGLAAESKLKVKALRKEIKAAVDSNERLTAEEVSAHLDQRMKESQAKRNGPSS